jgi:hypothetical protein
VPARRFSEKNKIEEGKKKGGESDGKARELGIVSQYIKRRI